MSMKTHEESYEKYPWYELVRRTNNFRWILTEEEVVSGHEYLYNKLYKLKKDWLSKIKKDKIPNRLVSEEAGLGNAMISFTSEHVSWCPKEMSASEILTKVFCDIYDTVAADFEIFQNHSIFYDSVYDSCLFTTLCLYLHNTKRIKGTSLGSFIYQHSPMDYRKKHPSHKGYKDDILYSETATLRKMRNRLFTSRRGMSKNPQWAAMDKDSEYEWLLYFAFHDEAKTEDFKDMDVHRDAKTFKRIGNLYNDFEFLLDTGCVVRPNYSMGNDSKKEVVTRYMKFLSKLKKIHYADYLKLIQDILFYIKKDKTYYGINLYRLEKRLHPCIVTQQVNRLLLCQKDADEEKILTEFISLNTLWFPELYNQFSIFSDSENMKFLADEFSNFLTGIVVAACLVIDELVEKGHLGDDWEALIISITNDMAERVFFSPSRINTTAPEGTEEKFIKLLNEPVWRPVFQFILDGV